MLRELAHLQGFSKMIETILLDDDKERTPIRLKLKAIKFIAYVWKEKNSTSSNENTSADILTSEELKKFVDFSFQMTGYILKGNIPSMKTIVLCGLNKWVR